MEIETKGSQMPQKEDKVLASLSNKIDVLYDIIANRVEDLRSINNTLFGEEPTSELKKYNDSTDGAILYLNNKLDSLIDKADELLPEIKRLDTLA